MNNVTIYGDFTSYSYAAINSISVELGCDDNAEIFYRLNFTVEKDNDTIFIADDYYYRNQNDLINDLALLIDQVSKDNPDNNYLLKLKQNYNDIAKVIPIVFSA